MKDLRFALVGCGRIGQKHIGHMLQYGKVTAVCDILGSAREELATKYSCRAYSSIESLLAEEKNLDLIAVCTPNGLHASHSIAGLQAGVHVLCEKPMAITAKDCERMIKAADTSGKHLFIVKQNRFNLPVAELKKVIDEGRLGKIFNVQLNCFWNRNDAYYQSSDWRGTLDLDGGTLFTQFSHFIDLLYWMMGDVKKIEVLTANFMHDKTIDFEDTGVILLKFENGALGTINYTVNSYGKNMEGSITVFGEKGTVKVGGQYLNVLEYQSIENYTMQSVIETKPANDYGFYKGSMSNHDKVYSNVVEVLTRNASIATNGYEGLKTVEIIENIYKSVKQGGPVTLTKL